MNITSTRFHTAAQTRFAGFTAAQKAKIATAREVLEITKLLSPFMPELARLESELKVKGPTGEKGNPLMIRTLSQASQLRQELDKLEEEHPELSQTQKEILFDAQVRAFDVMGPGSERVKQFIRRENDLERLLTLAANVDELPEEVNDRYNIEATLVERISQLTEALQPQKKLLST